MRRDREGKNRERQIWRKLDDRRKEHIERGTKAVRVQNQRQAMFNNRLECLIISYRN